MFRSPSGYRRMRHLHFYFLRNPAETSYAIAYDSVRPKEPKSGSAVLGNIFNM